jgi:hypothetical protein
VGLNVGSGKTLSVAGTLVVTGAASTIDATAIGATTADTGAFTTLAASGAVTLSGGTANGVTYLNGSKVLTSGSALVFDGFSLGLKARTSALFYNTNSDNYARIQGATGSDNQLIFSLNSEGMRLTDTGLGIGTSSPAYKLDVQTAAGRFQVRDLGGSSLKLMNSTTGGNIGIDSAGGITLIYANGTETARFDASYNLLLGTTSGSGARLDVKAAPSVAPLALFQNTASREATIEFKSAHSAASDYRIGASINIADAFEIASASTSTTRLAIDSSGNLLVGTTTALGNGFAFQPNGSDTNVPLLSVNGNSSSNTLASFRLWSTSLSQNQFYVGYGGTIYARSTSITGLSDISEKENIRDLETGINTVLALQPRRFDWKNGSGENVAGFIAQEVQSVLPDLVESYKVSEDETKLGLKMGDMIPTLVKAIQEQQALIQSLKARLDAANL